MKVICIGQDYGRKEYETEDITIQEAAHKFGRANDIVFLLNDSNRAIAMALWPFGYKFYKYYGDSSVTEEYARKHFVPYPWEAE